MNFLTIATIFRGEDHWLPEWITYHAGVGVEHFYLFNNEPNPEPSHRILEPFIDQGIVTEILWPGEDQQMKAIAEALRLIKSQWVALIDVDEFILPRTENTIPAILDYYHGFGGLAINWACFGSSGLEQQPALATESFVKRGRLDIEINKHVKCIVNPKSVIVQGDPHHFKCNDLSYIVGENYDEVETAFRDHTSNTIRINHYLTRSKVDYQKRIERLTSRGEPSPHRIENWNNPELNAVEDHEIWERFKCLLR